MNFKSRLTNGQIQVSLKSCRDAKTATFTITIEPESVPTKTFQSAKFTFTEQFFFKLILIIILFLSHFLFHFKYLTHLIISNCSLTVIYIYIFIIQFFN